MGRLDKFKTQDKDGGRPAPHYQKHDMETAWRRGDWRRWEDVIEWLELHGRQDEELKGDVDEMLRDLRQLQYNRMDFPRNGDYAYYLAMELHDRRTPVTEKPEVPEADEETT